MDKFDYVYKDDSIRNLYNNITMFEDNDENGIAYHNFLHVCNVSLMVEKLLTKLNYDKLFIEEAKIVALLHDVGCIDGKKEHATRSYFFARKYLLENEIKLVNNELMLEAIKLHSSGFDTDNIVALVLILADTLDIKHTRLTKRGYDVVGMRQLQYIDDVLVDIDGDKLMIDFLCNDKIDLVELEEYYFIKKLFNSILSFSNKINLVPNVLINHNIWDAFLEFNNT